MHNIIAKSILSSNNGINIYRGCTHGCIYCDSRSECYQMDHAFEDIAVKENSLELLEDALKRKRKPSMIGTGSMADPYMPIEKELLYTRRSLEIIEKYNCGATLITKSDLVLRDIDILDRINKKAKAVVMITLTTANDNLCKIIEPNVAVTSRRVEVLKELKKHGIPTIVWLTPVLPFINDTEENLLVILNYCKESGVLGIVNFGFGVTLRKGNREYFYKNLDKYFPTIKDKYVKTFGDSYECPSPNNENLSKIFIDFCKNSGIISCQKELFEYMNTYPKFSDQISFF